MDVPVIYFDEFNKQVKLACIGSQFMGHATVDDMIKGFKEAHSGLDDVMNLIQLFDGWTKHKLGLPSSI